ncbi:MAG: tetratricopeptide repeat protein, partial [Elusimicrobia bacterium]|nr:tetratricopeptide repeat protein [Elusimicrobiota bacterium]
HDDLGERAEAAALLREVLALKPGDRDARWQLATVLEKMDKIAEAETEFRSLIASKPDDAPAMNYLGYALADRGLKLPEAESLIRGALALEPGNAAYRDSLGWVLYKQGKFAPAVAELEASARAIADDEALWDHLAHAYDAVGNTEAAWLAWRLAQTLGSKTAQEKAENLQKGMSSETLGELWRRHLEAAQGGVAKMSGLCELKGRIAGHAVSRQALFTFRAPGEVSFELLGPMFSTAWRARLDERGFSMDPFPVSGVDQARVEEAAQGAFAGIAAALSGAAFAPGPARMDKGWGRTSLMRPEWRIDLGEGLARSIAPADNGVSGSLSDFRRVRARQVPRLMETKGRFWQLAISCPEPKAEFTP